MRFEFKDNPFGKFLYVYADPGDSKEKCDEARKAVSILAHINALSSNDFDVLSSNVFDADKFLEKIRSIYHGETDQEKIACHPAVRDRKNEVKRAKIVTVSSKEVV